jgi:5'-AMP-activated protein kinase catalytic alpha subunit
MILSFLVISICLSSLGFLQVAVKILEKSRIKESADVRRVNREIKILKKGRHGNVIQLYEVLDTPNAIYLIMECCDG